jgi:hypothetical protein
MITAFQGVARWMIRPWIFQTKLVDVLNQFKIKGEKQRH